MLRLLKIPALVILTVVVCIVMYGWYYIRKHGLFNEKPRKPKYEIPVVYNIGWWSHQDALSVDSFDVTIADSKLNLFNAESLIAYTVKGHIAYKGHWQPEIKEVHISERLNRDTSLPYDKIIEITPVVSVRENGTVNGGTVSFGFTNEHTVTSGGWGNNRIMLKCGRFERIVELHQSK